MEKVVQFINKPLEDKVISYDKINIVFSKSKRYQGIVLVDDILMYDHKKLLTFRIKLENSIKKPFLKLRMFATPPGIIDKVFLNAFFIENKDNPFAFIYLTHVLMLGKPLNASTVHTQFPPLAGAIEKDARIKQFQHILNFVQVGDIIFTYNRTSNISKKIRQIDRSQWSHCGNMYDNRQIYEMTTEGAGISMINDLDPLTYNIAIYRLHNITNEQIEDFKKRIEHAIHQNYKYNWKGIFYMYLYRKFPKTLKFLRKRLGSSLSDLLNQNQLTLIAWV